MDAQKKKIIERNTNKYKDKNVLYFTLSTANKYTKQE